jgi:hypothetical protein
VEGEGTYVGGNPYLSYHEEGNQNAEGPGPDIPLRGVKIRHGTAHECGGNGVSGKSWYGGTPGGDGDDENSMHDLVITSCGYSPEASGTAALVANSCRADVYNIIVRDNFEHGILHFITNGTPASLDFDCRIYNIEAVRNGAAGVTARQGPQGDGPPLPLPRFRIYNVTAVENEDGVEQQRTSPAGFIRNCIALDNSARDIDPGPATQANNLTAGSQGSVFVNPGSDDYHLDAQQLAVGTRGVEISFADIEGTDRPAGSASKGAYQFP